MRECYNYFKYLYYLLVPRYTTLQYNIVLEDNKALQAKYDTVIDMTLQKSAKAVRLNDFYVHDHAVYRYIERYKDKNTKENIRNMIHKQCLNYFVSKELIKDGKYNISKDLTVVIEDSSVRTVYKPNKPYKGH